jgi:(hydroxyamino)benzene mutase
MVISEYGVSFLRLGCVLFLLALLTGLAIPAFRNPRIALSGHVSALMNGTFIAVVGLASAAFDLSGDALEALYWITLYGTYSNWLANLFAAAFGTSRITPIAGAGHTGKEWQEKLATFGFVTSALAMLVAVGLVLYGLRHHA